MVQDTHYFKAILKAVYPSHSEGEERIVYGVAMYGQVPEEQAIHIGLLQGLGQSIVKKIKFYKSGEAWYKITKDTRIYKNIEGNYVRIL